MTVMSLWAGELVKHPTFPDCMAVLAKNDVFVGLVRVGGNIPEIDSLKTKSVLPENQAPFF